MRFLVIAILSVLLTPCFASDLYTPRLKNCLDKSGGVTITMIECISAEVNIHDERLNTNYKLLLASLSPSRKKELIEAQRAWLQFRELNCKFYYDPEGGTLARVAANDCFLKRTAERANELKFLAQ